MKIQCDVCNNDSATFFCPADDAALCAACDRRVHQINKLAGKHHRFSLTNTPSSSSSSQQIPLCDICQENRAFLFCQQDRAILCKGCDYSIHNANKNTHNHSRFLLTGTKLSLDSSPLHSAAAGGSVQVQPIIANLTAAVPSPEKSIGGGDTSSISEYLIQTLPGWNVDDFLDSCCSHTFDFSKGIEEGEEKEEEFMSIWEDEFIDNASPINLSENSSIWVPQTPTHPQYDSPYALISTPKMAVIEGEIAIKNMKDCSSFRKWTDDNDECLTVPQICNQSIFKLF